MRNVLLVVVALCMICSKVAIGQGIHFSQYYNTPMLLNAANTGLMPDNDYRLGMNYRNQWAAIPVPYNTFSAWGDCKIGGNANNTNHNNWLGIGFAFFSDKAGDGNLSLGLIQGDLAYHLQLSEFTMLSLGLSGAYAQRSVNYDNLTFDAQWDGFTFNGNMPNGEKVGILKTTYYTIGSGLNFAWFPNEFVYTKLGIGLTNINKPVETFYKGGTNTLDYRPSGNLDMLFRTGPVLIINPSVYYSTQSGASELLAGSLFRILLNDSKQAPAQLILGSFIRLGDAAIGVAGVQISRWQFMASYDFTMSALAPYNASYGALEFSLIYQGPYHPDQGITKAFSCPRFF
ncbi:MAG: PorP/SprF family type IX secretion system membrane protein [Chitinophagales bacterium]